MPDVNPGLLKSPIFKIRGQTDKAYPDLNMSPEQTVTLENVNLTQQGTATRRAGYALYNSNQVTESGNSKDFTGLAQFPFKAGSEEMSFAGTKFYEETGGTRTDRTGSLSLTDDTDLRWRIVFFQDSMVATNGTDEVVRWTGSGNATDLTSSASVPFTTCQALVPHRNLLVALRPTVGGADHTTRVMWCDLNLRQYTADITNFPADSFAEVYDQGPPIIGGADFNDILYIFKEDGFYPTQIVYDTGFFELNILGAIRGFAPIAPNGIVTRVGNPSFIWVIARDGAYVVNPDNSFTLMTKDLQSDWNDLNQGRLQYAVSFIRQQDHQVRTLLSSTTNAIGHDKVLVWDWETGDTWFDVPTDAVNYADSWVISNTEYDMYGSAEGYLYRANDASEIQDNTANYAFNIKHVPNDLGYPGSNKNIINAVTYYRAQAGQQTIEYSAIINEGRNLTRTGNLSFGTALQWDTGLKYNSGLKWPGGQNAKASFFVNRSAETIASRWTSEQKVEIIGVQYEFTVSE